VYCVSVAVRFVAAVIVLRRLVCGDVCGRFAQLFARVTSIQKKAGQFDVIGIFSPHFSRQFFKL